MHPHRSLRGDLHYGPRPRRWTARIAAVACLGIWVAAFLPACSSTSSRPLAAEGTRSPLLDALDESTAVELALDRSWLTALSDAACPVGANPTRQLGCKVVRPRVLKAGTLPNGDSIAMLKYGLSIKPAEATTEDERRANEEARRLNPKGFLKDDDGYFLVENSELEVIVLQVRSTDEGLRLIDMTSTSDPALNGDVPGG